jgi:hypothetical protein
VFTVLIHSLYYPSKTSLLVKVQVRKQKRFNSGGIYYTSDGREKKTKGDNELNRELNTGAWSLNGRNDGESDGSRDQGWVT